MNLEFLKVVADCIFDPKKLYLENHLTLTITNGASVNFLLVVSNEISDRKGEMVGYG